MAVLKEWQTAVATMPQRVINARQFAWMNRLPIFTVYTCMKTLLAALLATSLSAPLFSAAQVEVVFFGGPQASSARYSINDAKQSAGYKYGGMAGVAMKVPFDNQLFFFPSVFYSAKGYTVDFTERAFPPSEYAVNNNTRFHTVEIAPLLQLDFSKKPSHGFARFGPSVDLILTGKETFDTVNTAGVRGSVSRPMVFSFGDYGRIAASINLHLGYENEKGWMIFGFYEHGVGSMNNADYGPRILNRVYGLGFGWKIGRNPLVFDTRARQ